MKNYRKISKKRKIKGFVLGSLVPSLAVLSIVFSSVCSVSVKADSIPFDTFNDWRLLGSANAGDSSIGVGGVQFSMGSYSFSVDHDLDFSATTQNNTLNVAIDALGGSTTTERFFNWRFNYSFSAEDTIVARILFPSNFLGKVINGSISHTFKLTNDDNAYPRMYSSDWVLWELPSNGYSSVLDWSARWSLSSASSGGNGYNISVTPNPSNPYYNITVSFDNYYVPLAGAGNTRVGILEIPLNFQYHANFVYGGEPPIFIETVPATALPPLLSVVLLDVNPYANPTSFLCSFSGASFLLDNDYYTILHAIADQTFLQNEAADIAYLKNLLSTWCDASSSTMIPINFGDFALAIYDYLESFDSILTDSELADLSMYLSNLWSLQESSNDILNDLYTHLRDLGLSEVQSDAIDDLSDDILEQVNYEHRYYGSLLTSLQSNLDSVISNAPNFSSLQSPANFYIGCLQSLYTSIGSFAIVISVVLLGGVLLRIIGRIH